MENIWFCINSVIAYGQNYHLLSTRPYDYHVTEKFTNQAGFITDIFFFIQKNLKLKMSKVLFIALKIFYYIHTKLLIDRYYCATTS